MRKSQHVFVIMAVVYTIIAILNLGEWIEVSENILLGLSMSALFSALSDILSNIVSIHVNQNELGYMVQTTSVFLEAKISNNICSPLIDARNVKLNVENMSNRYKKAVHPNEYSKNKTNKIISLWSQGCFICAIAAFILAPFPLILFQQSYSVLLTLCAFAAMCLNLYYQEVIADIIEKKNRFFCDTQLIIQMAYSDFTDFLNFRIYHYENYITLANIANKQEDKSNADT